MDAVLHEPDFQREIAPDRAARMFSNRHHICRNQSCTDRQIRVIRIFQQARRGTANSESVRRARAVRSKHIGHDRASRTYAFYSLTTACAWRRNRLGGGAARPAAYHLRCRDSCHSRWEESRMVGSPNRNSQLPRQSRRTRWDRHTPNFKRRKGVDHSREIGVSGSSRRRHLVDCTRENSRRSWL